MNIDINKLWQTVTHLVNGLLAAAPTILLGVLCFLCFYYAAKGARVVITRLASAKGAHRGAGLVVGRLVQTILVVLGLLVALVIAIPTFHPGQLVEMLGIGSVAVGFAFRDILQNFLAGILILWTQPFRIDDQIVVGSFEGTVEDIQTRATMIRTYDGRRVVIPNSSLFTQAVIVNTAYLQRRIEYDIGIGYGDDVGRAKELILEAMKETAGVLTDPVPDTVVMELAASTVNVRARWWIDPPRRSAALDSRDSVLRAIKKKLTDNGIDLPFPTQQVLFHDQTEACDGDRAHQREGWPAGQDPVPAPRRAAILPMAGDDASAADPAVRRRA